MDTAPYTNSFRERGELCFRAEAPALAHIGELYDELGDAHFKSGLERIQGARTPREGSTGPDQPEGTPSPDYGQIMADQMNALRQSPQFDQMREYLKSMRDKLAQKEGTRSNKGQIPLKQLNKALQFLEDRSPFPPLDLNSTRPKPNKPPRGEFKFSCGSTAEVTPAQIELFDHFRQNQERLRPQIESALRELHEQMCQPGGLSRPEDRVYFPEDSDVALDCFRIRQLALEPKADQRIVVTLDSHFPHYDEHGCYLLIRRGTVQRFGCWDEVFAYEPNPEEGED